jgi:diketogulonate reductase-like aldo/keto reductase
MPEILSAKFVLPLPKSVTPANIKSNLDVDYFNISEEDMKAIASMEESGFSGLNPTMFL